jgi:hypothetical protein
MKQAGSWVIAVFMIFTGAPAFAQATGTVNGRVVDQADAVLPGATVTATNTRTGVARTTVTNGEGLYSLPALEPGLYNVSVDLTGFAPSNRRDLTLAVGATVTLDVKLQLGTVTENIVVSGAAPLIETTQSVARATLMAKEVESLPLLNRNFTGMVTLLPGARPIGAVNATKQSVGQMSFSGGQGRNLNTVVDGGDNRDESVGGVVQNYTVEGIEEFTLSTHRFSAANGRSAGALLTIVTKSGTNDIHGSGFLFGRDEALTKVDYFAKQSNQPKVPFNRQQFGGSAGGPLVRNRAFFFGAVERIREEQSISVPEGVFRELELLRPLGAEPVRAVPRSYRDTQYTAKANITFTPNQSGIVRFAEQRNRQTNNQVNAANKDVSAPTADINRMYSLLASHTAVISSRLLNQFTFQKTYLWNSLDAVDDTWNLPFGRNLSFPSVTMGRQVTQQLNRQDKLQFRDDFTAQLGTHALKVGADYVKLPNFAVYQDRDGNGSLTFFDDPSVILTDKVRYPQGFQTPGIVRQFTVGNSVGDGSFINAQQFSAYVQDDWKATRRLSLNLGVRYDVNFNFINETVMANSRTYKVLQAIGDPYGALPKTDTNDISPRVGFAYNLRGDGTTVLRGGYGLYYDAMTLSVAFPNLYQMREFIKVTSTLVNTAIGRGDLATYRFGIDPPLASAGNVKELPPGGLTSGAWYDPNLTSPYNHQTTFGFAHQIGPRTVIDADFTRVRGENYYRNNQINPLINGVRRLAPVLGARLGDRNLLGSINILGSTSKTSYDELAVKLVHRADRMNWQASYTLSNAQAYGGGVGITGATAAPQDWDAPNAPGEWGPVRVDERHRVVLFAVAELPFGIRVSPIFQASTPRAYTLTAGVDLNADGSNNDRYVDPATGRQVSINSERGDPLTLLDLRVTKFFTMGSENRRIGVFAEFYNLFNTANFGNNYNGNARSSQFKQPQGFMGGAGYPFQMQLGIRASF